jgi:hypothetical protein
LHLRMKFVLLCIWLCIPALAPADFAVDFGVADKPPLTSVTPNDVAPGFYDFAPDPEFGGGGPGDSYFTISPISRVVSGVTVTVQGGGNGAVYQDYTGEMADVSGISGDLLEERVRVVQADLNLTLTNLSAGTYTFTGFHHDAGATQSSLPFDIFVNEGSGERLAYGAVLASTGFTPTSISTTSFDIFSSGSPISIRFDGGGAGLNLINPVLNGFTVTSVPEPSAMTLAALVITTTFTTRSIRRRKPRSQARTF